MKRLLLVAAFAGAPALGATFHDCGVTFSYPDRWTAKAGPREQIYLWEYKKNEVRCAIGLRPPGWVRNNDRSTVDLGKWALTIVVIDRPFLEVAWKAGFARAEQMANDDGTLPFGLRPGGWGILVRQGVAPAQQFHTTCCQAVRGSSWSHTTSRDGDVATVTSESAVLNDRQGHSAIVDAVVDEQFSDVITQIVTSFRFGR
ncbi:MAG TPA: hypothetical protein VII12_08235 [Thermoanaerobaculia bacterium]|jgi:hypothetical protein